MAELLQLGVRAFKESQYGEASRLFETYLSRSTSSSDPIDPMVLYEYGVSVLFEVLKDKNCDDREEKLDKAYKALKGALAIVDDNLLTTKAQDRIDISIALGEVASKKGDLEDAILHFSKALNLLEPLTEADNPDLAFLNYRIFSCYARGGSLIAIPYCLKAISICRNRQIRMASEVTDLSDQQAIQERQAEIKTLTSQRSFYLMKLDDFRCIKSKQDSWLKYGKLLLAVVIFALEFTVSCLLQRHKEGLDYKVVVLVLEIILVIFAFVDCILTEKEEREKGATWRWGKPPPCFCLREDDGSISCNLAGFTCFFFSLCGLVTGILELTNFQRDVPPKIHFNVWPTLYALFVALSVLYEVYRRKLHSK